MSVDTGTGHIGPWTEEDWLALPDSTARTELVDGTLLVSASPGGLHQRVTRNLSHALDTTAPDPYSVLQAVNVRVGPGRVLIPDLVVLDEPDLLEKVYDAAMVVLAVEVTSPSNAGTDRVLKHHLYSAAGIAHYLRIDLDAWPDRLGGVLYSLTPDGGYAEVARSDERARLVLDRPFAVRLDLDRLARTTRFPRP